MPKVFYRCNCIFFFFKKKKLIFSFSFFSFLFIHTMSSSQEMQNMAVHQTIHENVAVESNYGNMTFFI